MLENLDSCDGSDPRRGSRPLCRSQLHRSHRTSLDGGDRWRQWRGHLGHDLVEIESTQGLDLICHDLLFFTGIGLFSVLFSKDVVVKSTIYWSSNGANPRRRLMCGARNIPICMGSTFSWRKKPKKWWTRSVPMLPYEQSGATMTRFASMASLYLVGGLEYVLFFHILGIIIPFETTIYLMIHFSICWEYY